MTFLVVAGRIPRTLLDAGIRDATLDGERYRAGEDETNPPAMMSHFIAPTPPRGAG